VRVHCLQHVPFEGLAQLGAWLEARGWSARTTPLWEGAPLPAPEAFDWLIVLGGPMSVHDEAEHPWLAAEKRLIGAALEREKTVLGICLGAQLIASALGAPVRRAPEREVGWFPVERVGDDAAWPLPPAAEVFHWHGETFELPAGARHLARSAGCPNQAFALGERVLALQFHLETTPEAARALIAHCPGDLCPGRFVQDASEMLREPVRFERLHTLLEALLEPLARRAAAAIPAP
jgi:GMP synthase-like glutamine amidotransferase